MGDVSAEEKKNFENEVEILRNLVRLFSDDFFSLSMIF